MKRFAFVGLLVLACGQWSVGPFKDKRAPQPEAPDPWHSDDTYWGATHSLSVQACAHYAEMNCPESRPTRSGVSCVENLDASELAHPQHFTFGAACVIRTHDCVAATACAHRIP